MCIRRETREKVRRNLAFSRVHHGQSYGLISHLYLAVGLKAKLRYDFIKIIWLLYYFILIFSGENRCAQDNIVETYIA
jgi:hypothetical protein